MTDEKWTVDLAKEYVQQEAYAVKEGIFPKGYMSTGVYAKAHGFLLGWNAAVGKAAEILKTHYPDDFDAMDGYKEILKLHSPDLGETVKEEPVSSSPI